MLDMSPANTYSICLSTHALGLLRYVGRFCRLRALEGSLKTLSQFFSLNEALVQFELPGDVDNRVSVPPPRPHPSPRRPRTFVFRVGLLVGSLPGAACGMAVGNP